MTALDGLPAEEIVARIIAADAAVPALVAAERARIATQSASAMLSVAPVTSSHFLRKVCRPSMSGVAKASTSLEWSHMWQAMPWTFTNSSSNVFQLLTPGEKQAATSPRSSGTR